MFFRGRFFLRTILLLLLIGIFASVAGRWSYNAGWTDGYVTAQSGASQADGEEAAPPVAPRPSPIAAGDLARWAGSLAACSSSGSSCCFSRPDPQALFSGRQAPSRAATGGTSTGTDRTSAAGHARKGRKTSGQTSTRPDAT